MPFLRRYGYAIALAIVVLAGFGLRTYDLSRVPTELIVDELDLYNSARSIVTTGHDVDGSLLPFLYAGFTRNPPMYALAGYASTLIFGKNAFGLRFPAVLFGIASIVLLYGIALELTGRRDIALIAALLEATAPIFIHFSRIAWEPASELPFLLGGLYVLLRARSFAGYASAAVLLGLTSYTYMAGWFYAVVLAGGFLILNGLRFRSARGAAIAAGACAIWLLVSAPALRMWFFDPLTSSRTARIATFANGVSFDTLRTFAANYLSHFTISYLVTTGDPKAGITWRYLNGFGAFYWWIVPLAAAGLAASLQLIREKPMRAWVWLWLLAYPLGGALTNEGAPNAPRTLAGAPVFCILAAMGFAVFTDWAAGLKPPRSAHRALAVLRAAMGLAVATSTALFCDFYFTRYVHVNSNAWDSGTRAMFAAVRSALPRYQRVCFSVRPAWYGIDTYVRYYLEDLPEQKIDDINAPACFLPGTLVVTDTDHPLARQRFVKIARIDDVDGAGFAFIYGRLQ